jgi:hypothetical protein
MENLDVQTTAQAEIAETPIEATPIPQEVVVETPQAPAEPYKFNLKYNHNEVVIDSEERVRELAQLGMNQPKNEARMRELENKIKGYEADSVKGKVAALVEQGYDETVALNSVMFEVQEVERVKQTEISNQEKSLKDTRKSILDEFTGKYPDFAPKDWTPEMLTAYEKGESLIPHYTAYENTKLKAENTDLSKKISAWEVNKANAEASTGALDNSSPAESNIYTQDQYDNLTREAYKADPAKADRSMAYYSKK